MARAGAGCGMPDRPFERTLSAGTASIPGRSGEPALSGCRTATPSAGGRIRRARRSRSRIAAAAASDNAHRDPVRPIGRRADRDAAHAVGAADRCKPEPVPVSVDERTDKCRSGPPSRTKKHAAALEVSMVRSSLRIAFEIAGFPGGLGRDVQHLASVNLGLAQLLAQRLRAHPS